MAQSRSEDILEAIVNGEPYALKPLSRGEALLLLLKNKIDMGGSSPEEIKQHVYEYLQEHGTEDLTNIVVVGDEGKITDGTQIFFKNGITLESPDMQEFNSLVQKTIGSSTLTLEEIDQIFKEV